MINQLPQFPLEAGTSILINQNLDIFQIELFHDQLPLAVPCYDLFPVTDLTVVPACAEPSGTTGSLELTGGEYKTRERIHRSLADLRLLAIPASKSRVADSYPN